MDASLYHHYLTHYLAQAQRESDGSVRSIAEQLGTYTVHGLVVRHREEKQRALADARRAFDDHRHWPLEIILSHLGVRPEELRAG